MTDARLITRHLGASLEAALDGAGAAYLLSAFIMVSGVEYLWTALRRAAQAGTEIKILTGDYLYVTEPDALSRLAELGPAVEIRLWQSAGDSFHPKAYLFETAAGGVTVIVGSSNLSRAALTTGVEWSVRLGSADLLGTDPVAEFMRLFYGDRTVPVNPVTIQQYAERRKDYLEANPGAVPAFESENAAALSVGEAAVGADSEQLELRPAQEAALAALAATMEEGYDRALVVLPTGLGKTYLAAIFARQFARVLFVAHREEILRQAAAVFSRQLPGRTQAFYYGAEKSDGDMVFASPYTLAVKSHRERFAPEAFDLIVVDEFHHAVARSYQALLQHFRPRFLLGLTATPDRHDYKDVYALCDGNVAYRVGLYEAVQAGWLASFRYYGVYDPIDYAAIRWRGTHYDEDDLVRAQTQHSHAEAVYAGWREHRQSRTLGFCSSVRQADFLANYFRGQGVRAVSLHGGSPDALRRRALEGLAAGSVDVVFSVDLFNEGVDIPTVDTILLVRPTESSTVFLQQIGRGLRTAPGKSVCVIVDFIGNYRHADSKLSLLGMDGATARGMGSTLELPTVPDGCAIELDLAVIDLLKRLMAQKNPRRGPLERAYRTLWQDLGRRPTYLELHLEGGVDTRLVRQEFGSYVGMLKWLEVLSEEEVGVYDRYRGWLDEVERTAMSKSYKMILLQAMLNRGEGAWAEPILAAEVAPFFHRYLTEREYRKRIDFSDKALRPLWQYDESAVARKIWQMPMSKWAGSSGGRVFIDERGRFGVRLDGTDAGVLAILHGWTQEIVAYRLHTYFERKGARNGRERS